LIALTNPVPDLGTHPASADNGPYANRSWIAPFVDTGTAPDLGTAHLLSNPAAVPGLTGNWMIRATGTNASGHRIEFGEAERK
jgi:hypothetical protein